jgi:hypothetical protein
LTSVLRLYWQARQRTGLGPRGFLGGAGGSHRGPVGDRVRVPRPVKPSNSRPQSLCAGRAEPERERTYKSEGRKKRRGVDRHTDSRERTERGGCKPSGQACVCRSSGMRRNYLEWESKPSSSLREISWSGWSVRSASKPEPGSSASRSAKLPYICRSVQPGRRFFLLSEQSRHRNALPTKWVSPGQRAGSRSSNTPCVPVLTARQRERQAGYRKPVPRPVTVQAVVPSEGGAQGNGRGVYA